MASNAPRLSYKFYDKDLGERELIKVHHGQRKLLMNEIEFLLIGLPKIKTKEKTVLYIGAASGQHHIILQKMFPDVRFILYDGNKFHSDIKKLPKYHFYEKLFGSSRMCISSEETTGAKSILMMCPASQLTSTVLKRYTTPMPKT
jgi:hypothetical protein